MDMSAMEEETGANGNMFMFAYKQVEKQVFAIEGELAQVQVERICTYLVHVLAAPTPRATMAPRRLPTTSADACLHPLAL